MNINYLVLYILFFLFTSCDENKEGEKADSPKEEVVQLSDVILPELGGLLFFKQNMEPVDGILYNGENKFGLYVKGLKEGLHKKYSFDKGKITSEGNFIKGLKDGTHISYTSDNNRYERNYKNGKLNGVVESFYRNDQLKSRSYYLNGFPHGLAQKWNESGNIIEEFNYVNGKLRGECFFWVNEETSIEYFKSENGQLNQLMTVLVRGDKGTLETEFRLSESLLDGKSTANFQGTSLSRYYRNSLPITFDNEYGFLEMYLKYLNEVIKKEDELRIGDSYHKAGDFFDDVIIQTLIKKQVN